MWSRRLVGWVWLGLWIAVLVAVHAPWRSLGGIVSERLRWVERATLGTCAIVGATVGSLGRARASRPGGPSHAAQMRTIWLPVAGSAAVVVAGAEVSGAWAVSLVTLVGFLGYWAGLDTAFGAWPLMHGAPYAFRRPLPDR